MPFNNFYRGKRVLVTGHTGFKGGWLSNWLDQLGAEVYGVALEPSTDPALFNLLGLSERIHHQILDLRDPAAIAAHIAKVRPEVVFHLAAQPIVRLSYKIPLETLESNVMGTANLLHAIGQAGYTADAPCTVVAITSDKCYENRETYLSYNEDDPMGGHDIYSVSKGMAELLISSWRRSFFSANADGMPAVLMASCRAGNVVGGGDWSPDRIVVDSMRALTAGKPINVRNPLATRPWQHVLEPLSGYLLVGASLGARTEHSAELQTGWNFGPGRSCERTVGELADALVEAWGSGSWEHAPEFKAVHEARFLKLAIEKAWHYLRWQPVWDFEATIEATVRWYKTAHESGYDSKAMVELTNAQTKQFIEDATAKALDWAAAEAAP